MNDQDPALWKTAARKRIRQVLAGIAPAAAEEKSGAACETLLGLDEFARAGVVMLYMPIPGEVDTAPIAAGAWRAGKTVLLPKVRSTHGDMIAVAYRTVDDPMVLGRYNIREPAADEPWPADRIDLIVVPALAFDRRGNRLGKGGGYYDRFLSQPGLRAAACGLVFAEQVIESVPVQPHDRQVPVLVTDREIIRFAPPGAGQRNGL